MSDTEVLFNYKHEVLWGEGVGFPAAFNFKHIVHYLEGDDDPQEFSYVDYFAQSLFGFCPVCNKLTPFTKMKRKDLIPMIDNDSENHAYSNWLNGQRTKLNKDGFVCAHCGRDYNPHHGGIFIKDSRDISNVNRRNPMRHYITTKLVIEKKDNKIIVRGDLDTIVMNGYRAFLPSRHYYYCCFDLQNRQVYISEPGERSYENKRKSYKLPKKFKIYSLFYENNLDIKGLFNFLPCDKDCQEAYTVLIKALGLPQSLLNDYVLFESIATLFCTNGKDTKDMRQAVSLYNNIGSTVNRCFYCETPGILPGINRLDGLYVFDSWLKKLRYLFKHSSLSDALFELSKPKNMVYLIYFSRCENSNRKDNFSWLFDYPKHYTEDQQVYYELARASFYALWDDQELLAKFTKHVERQQRFKLYRKCKMLERVAA